MPDTITSQAPLESNISREHEYTDLIHLMLADTRRTIDASIVSLMGDFLSGCGRVDLMHLDIIYKCSAADQFISVGMSSTTQSLTVQQAAFKGNGVSFTATNLTMGVRHSIRLIPEDNLSRQIQPVSSDLPSMKLLLECSKGVEVQIVLAVKVRGIRMHFNVLNK